MMMVTSPLSPLVTLLTSYCNHPVTLANLVTPVNMVTTVSGHRSHKGRNGHFSHPGHCITLVPLDYPSHNKSNTAFAGLPTYLLYEVTENFAEMCSWLNKAFVFSG